MMAMALGANTMGGQDILGCTTEPEMGLQEEEEHKHITNDDNQLEKLDKSDLWVHKVDEEGRDQQCIVLDGFKMRHEKIAHQEEEQS